MAETTEYIKELKKKNPDRDGDTLEDLEKEDLGNLDYLLPGVVRYGGKSSSDANLIVGKLYTKALSRLGINMQMISQIKGGEYSQTRVVGQLMEKNGIVVERRSYDDNPFRDGLYFYKKGEIAYFISTPTPTAIITSGTKDRVSIVSNVIL